MHELKLAFRRMRRRPVRSLTTASTLAIGVGASVAAFAAVDTVLLRDLPVVDQEELVVAWRLNPERASLRIPFTTEDYGLFARGQGSLVDVAGFTAWGALPVLVDDADGGYPVNEVRVAGDFFGVLGARPTIGRLLEPSDDVPGSAPVVVLTHGAWRTRFASDPGVLGSTLVIRDQPTTIVGVGPEGLDFPQGTDVWSPLQQAPFELHFIGRRLEGVTQATVSEDITATFRAEQEEGAAFFSNLQPIVVDFEEHIVGAVRPLLRTTLGAALLLLMVGVANTALFLMAGGRSVAHEIAVRRALGAQPRGLVGRVAADASLSCLIGTITGVVLAWALLSGLLPLAPPELPRLEGTTLTRASVGVALAVGLLSTLVAAGLANGVLSRLGGPHVLVSGNRAGADTGLRLRQGVAGLQISLTVVSGVGAGLLARTVSEMDRLDPGMAVGDMLAVDLRIPYGWGSVPPTYADALETIVADLEAQPGIISARPTLGPPLQQRLEVVLAAEGQSEEDRVENPYVAVDAVLPGHFEALGIAVLEGRSLTGDDNRPDAEAVAVVDAVLARALWPGEEALGKRITSLFAEDEWFTIVGVVAPTRYRQFLQAHPRAYYPLRKVGGMPPSALLIRTAGVAQASVAEQVRRAVLQADPDVRVMSIRSMTDVLRGPTVGRRFAASVLLVFAGATLLLAALGVYGVFTVSVHEKTQEIGVRRALGAQRSGLVTLVLSGILKVATFGAVAGIGVALFTGRLVESVLFGVTPTDPPTLVVVFIGSLIVAALAGLVPALRASAIDPMTCLRSE